MAPRHSNASTIQAANASQKSQVPPSPTTTLDSNVKQTTTTHLEAPQHLHSRPRLTFESLPPEIRLMIYRCCIENFHQQTFNDKQNLAVMSTNKLIHEEFRAEFWSKVAVELTYYRTPVDGTRDPWKMMDMAKVLLNDAAVASEKKVQYPFALAMPHGVTMRELTLTATVHTLFRTLGPGSNLEELWTLARNAIRKASKIGELKIFLFQGPGCEGSIDASRFLIACFNVMSHLFGKFENVQKVTVKLELPAYYFHKFPGEKKRFLGSKRRIGADDE